MERWRAAQSLGPDDRPGAVFMTVTAGEIKDTGTEWLAARVIARHVPGDEIYEPERLESGIKALIIILQDKLEALRRERNA